MLAIGRPRAPTTVETKMFERFAVDVRTVAMGLAYSSRFAVDGRSELDLSDPRQAEFGVTALAAAAKQHRRRGEDLLALVERIIAMVNAGPSARLGRNRFEAGLQLLCAVAMAELLQEEAGRYRHDAELRGLADGAMARLADGFVVRFGPELPDDVTRAFPRFAGAVRRVPPWVRERAAAGSLVA